MAILLEHLLFAVALFSVTVFAFLRGNTEVRFVAAALLVSAIATAFVIGEFDESMEAGILLVDVILLLAILIVALRSERYWPMFAAGFHLNAIMIHLAVYMNIIQFPHAYANLLALWSYMVLVPVFIGAMRSARTFA